jgi:hypothetical protein
MRLAWETVARLVSRAPPLRTAGLLICCDPFGPQIQFGGEPLIDSISRRPCRVPPPSCSTLARDSNALGGRGIAFAERSDMGVAIIAGSRSIWIPEGFT